MFRPVENNAKFPELEQEILSFWRDGAIYQKSLDARAESPRFVFYEGPPTANGLPHPGHCLTRTIKDLFPRYRTMRGYLCERKGGWDTHGLPVEVEVCKELGIHSKEQIEEFGIEPFIHKCQASVWRYMQEWERLTERLGFWIHLEQAYVTYHQRYVESVWWSLKSLFDRGLLYQGHKIVWWWAQGGTALSSGEVGGSYREVADPSAYVRFPLLDEPDTSLLVWTTTPWTLISNQFAAVHPELDYVRVSDDELGVKLIVAAGLVETIASKTGRPLTVEKTLRGSELIGRRYRPPYDYYYSIHGGSTGKLKTGDLDHLGWRVVAADFVTLDSGSGVVHQAPAFGEVDYDVLVEDQARFVDGAGPELLCAVGPDGKFTADAPEYEGRWVKDADKDICRDLKARELLYHREQYLHEYPFCWRADQDPLIQYPRRSWFIRTSDFKHRMVDNNHLINWLPDHIRDGRFGNFLENNVDWALSRERYWGTPLPIWTCDETGQREAISSYDELLSKPDVRGQEVWEAAKQANPDLPDDLRVHKPYIDEITYQSPFSPTGRMHRVTEVIDCWYDAGAMPFAQWGYPQHGQKEFEQQFPADFISEALDQTRGWFYSLLAISTLLFDKSEEEKDGEEKDEGKRDTPEHDFPHPFANCIVLGLMLGEDGTKMSKQKRNYREPQEIFDRYGADALRWYFLANQPPWTSIRYSEASIKDSIPEFLLRLWNVYSFFVNYANPDGFEPAAGLPGDVGQLNSSDLSSATGYRSVADRGELDRWILSELQQTVGAVVKCMDAYDNYAACQHLNDFVDGLSNWYVRRSRKRFWSSDKASQSKLDAYWTMYECLVATSKLIAPFVPFMAETIWQNLASPFAGRASESVHLCDYPTVQEELVDEQLSTRMRLLRTVASLGLSARMDSKIKVRQPLAKVEVILAEADHQAWLETHDELLRAELNVKQVAYTKDADKYITYEVLPNFKRLGPRVGKQMPAVKRELAGADGSQLLAQLTAEGRIVLDLDGQQIELDNDDIQVRLKAKEGWAAAQCSDCVVVLSTELSDSLVREGYARDLVRFIQDRRKQLRCEFADNIDVAIVTASEDVRLAVSENQEYITRETLAKTLTFDNLADVEPAEHQLADEQVSVFVVRVAI